MAPAMAIVVVLINATARLASARRAAERLEIGEP
jgi:hypothetical protein